MIFLILFYIFAILILVVILSYLVLLFYNDLIKGVTNAGQQK